MDTPGVAVERVVRGLAVALATTQVVGTAVARRHGVDGRPFGIRLDLGSVATPLLWGTGIFSAPLVMAAGLAAASARPRRTAPGLAALAGGIVVGTLAEPVTWRRRRPRAVRTMVLLNATLAPALAVTSARLARRQRGA